MKAIEIATFLVFLLVAAVFGEQRCDFEDLTKEENCGDHEWCVETTNLCECILKYERKNNVCVPITTHDPTLLNYSNLVDNKGSGSIVAGILIPLFLIVFVMCGVYVTRKYHLVSWLRNRFHRPNENYDEFMIGQDDDDEPLS